MIFIAWLILMSLVCPKCTGLSWVEQDGVHVVQRCRCGLTKVLYFESDGMKCSRSPAKKGGFTIPARGTQLSKILGCLGVMGELDSLTIAARLRITMDKATTNLCVLKSRGLVTVVGSSKKKSTGSIWRIEPAVKKYYEV